MNPPSLFLNTEKSTVTNMEKGFINAGDFISTLELITSFPSNAVWVCINELVYWSKYETQKFICFIFNTQEQNGYITSRYYYRECIFFKKSNSV